MVRNKRALGVVGVIAGMLVLGGVFSPWVKGSAWGFSIEVSAWDNIKWVMEGEDVEVQGWAFLALLGAILLIVPALLTLFAPNRHTLYGILIVGGLITIISSVWAYLDIETGSMLDMSVNYGYGIHLALVGGILGLAGTLALRR